MNISEERLTQAILEYDDALMASLPDPSECVYVFSDSFERKMKKLIRKTDHYVTYIVHEAMRYAASILIALLVSASMIISFNPEARAAVVNWIKEYAHDVYNYFFTAEEVESNAEYVLGWLPDGYKLLDSLDHSKGKTYIYSNESGNLLHFSYMRSYKNASFTVGTGNYEEKRVVESDFQADLYISLEKDNGNAITWIGDDDEIIFSISAFENEDVLTKIAKSVTVK